MKQHTVVEQIELPAGGSVQVRLGLIVTNKGKQISHAVHRVSIQKHEDPAVVLADVMNHLVDMGREPIEEGDVNRICALHDYHKNV